MLDNSMTSGNEALCYSKKFNNIDDASRNQCETVMDNLTEAYEGCDTINCVPIDKQSHTVRCETSEGGWGWVIVLAAFTVNMICDGIAFSFGVLYIEFLSYFGESKGKTAWIGSVFFSVPLLCGPVASALVDRYGCRWTTIVGGILASTGFILSSFCDSLEMLYFTFGISGLGLALSYVATIVVVAFYFEKKRGFATGLSGCGSGLGTLLFAPVMTVCTEKYTWRGTTLILGAVFLNVVVCGAVMIDKDGAKKKKCIGSVLESLSTGSSPVNSNEEAAKTSLLSTNYDRLSNSLVQLPTYVAHGELASDIYLQKNIKKLSVPSSPTVPLIVLPCCDNNNSKLPDKLGKKTGKKSSASSQGEYSGGMNLPLKYHNQLRSGVIGVSESSKICSGCKVSGSDSSCKDENETDNQKSFLASTSYLESIKLHPHSLTYRGAMLNIHRYKLKASSCPNIYKNEKQHVSVNNGRAEFLRDMKETIIDMFDPDLFRSAPFMISCMSNFLLYICYDVPYIYMTDNAILHGITEPRAAFLISIIGILSAFGTILIGYIGDKPRINSLLLYGILISVCGIIVCTIPLLNAYWYQCIAAAMFGFLISANFTLMPVILVEIISLSHFTNAYGLLLLSQGVANLVGPPIAGFMFDITGAYNTSFYSAGAGILISGLMVAFVSRRPIAKSENQIIKEGEKDML